MRSVRRAEAIVAQAEATTPSEAHARALLDVATSFLDRSPRDAEKVFTVAAEVVRNLVTTPPLLSASLSGFAAKGRANAARMLGNYSLALTHLDDAKTLFQKARYCGSELAQVEYTRATVLFKLERWSEAAQAAVRSRHLFEENADQTRAIHARLVLGCIAVERGELDSARGTLLDLERVVARSNERSTLARVWMNLATCELRRGDAHAAKVWLAKAEEAFEDLGMAAELPRVRWCGAKIAALEGNSKTAIQRLTKAAREFDDLGMAVDAAFVSLDLLEVLVENEATRSTSRTLRLARDIADRFVRAGTGVSAAHALEYLRKMVVSGKADVSLIRYVSRYLRRFEVNPDKHFERRE